MNNNFSFILAKRLISVSEVANATGLSRTTLTNIYYRRSKNVSFSTLKILCDYLDISLSELIEYVPNRDKDIS
ncbi:toxin-antitoxin system, antitoxin component, Xre family protein [Bacillus cereus]|uniref:Toxin-antitoxin system, antitoxin component, Xre family protein n=1 Tax=Bacillus cereus TaxID=1396 RepID=A0A9X6UB09_BACCE|nr:helix-turn-helix transcriptional regulator [Bacillus cereus]PEN96244.1 toxin-antitoxin system, antitoxin component, Xre family protein [Bacillus cereus]